MKSRVHDRPRRAAPFVLGLLAMSFASSVNAAAEDWMAGAFDKITGVPFATTMLSVVRAGEESPLSPPALDARLSAVEKLLAEMETRLKVLDGRLKQVQDEVVKQANTNRLRELQRIRSDLEEINGALRTHPSDPSQRSILLLRARQQAYLLKDSIDFDIWKVSDVDASTQTIRTRFFVYPSFELYAMAISTLFAAIEFSAGDQPQKIVAEQGAFLREHATFLKTRAGFRELLDEPQSLPEHLSVAAYCRLEAVNKFADSTGSCVFASVCEDTMAGKSVETERQSLTMQPPRVGTLCTFNPAAAVGLKGERELRNAYGAELMAALATDLDRLGTFGSLREPFVGQFANFIHTQLFAAALEGPVLASRGATPGTLPAIPACMPVVGGCSFGVKLSQDTGWTVANSSPGVTTIRHDGSSLCLDIKNNIATQGAAVILFTCNGSPSQAWKKRMVNNVEFALATADGSLCATVEQASAGRGMFQKPDRGLLLQPCDGRALQTFSTSDGKSTPLH